MMKQLPITEKTLVLRTDFSDDKAWSLICHTISTPEEYDESTKFKASVEFLSDPAFRNMEKDEILSLIADEKRHPVIFVVDAITIKQADHPILCIDLMDEVGKDFRVVPSELNGIENNLSVGNFGFEELAELVDEDGVFRGIEADF